jgi:hypothetical protein
VVVAWMSVAIVSGIPCLPLPVLARTRDEGRESKNAPRPSELIAMLLPFHQAYEVSWRARTGSVLRVKRAFAGPVYDAPLFHTRNIGSPAPPFSMLSANTRERLRQSDCQHRK